MSLASANREIGTAIVFSSPAVSRVLSSRLLSRESMPRTPNLPQASKKVALRLAKRYRSTPKEKDRTPRFVHIHGRLQISVKLGASDPANKDGRLQQSFGPTWRKPKRPLDLLPEQAGRRCGGQGARLRSPSLQVWQIRATAQGRMQRIQSTRAIPLQRVLIPTPLAVRSFFGKTAEALEVIEPSSGRPPARCPDLTYNLRVSGSAMPMLFS